MSLPAFSIQRDIYATNISISNELRVGDNFSYDASTEILRVPKIIQTDNIGFKARISAAVTLPSDVLGLITTGTGDYNDGNLDLTTGVYTIPQTATYHLISNLTLATAAASTLTILAINVMVDQGSGFAVADVPLCLDSAGIMGASELRSFAFSTTMSLQQGWLVKFNVITVGVGTITISPGLGNTSSTVAINTV